MFPDDGLVKPKHVGAFIVNFNVNFNILNDFYKILYLKIFRKICRENFTFIKIGQE
jgi:hypothetical protein